MENGKVEFVEFEGPSRMLEAMGDWLEQHGAANNLLLGLLYRVARREAAGGESSGRYWGAYLDGRPKIAVLHLAQRTEMLMVAPEHGWEACLPAVVDYFKREMPGLHGIVAPDPMAVRFAEGFALEHRLVFQQSIMQLDRLVAPKPAKGGMRLATPADAPLVMQWLKEFFRESLHKNMRDEEVTQLARGKILEKTICIWDCDGPQSMAGLERPTQRGITVVLVYTPPQSRGRGYASNLVAAMTSAQLEAGRKFLCLHTDRNFPTSNKIYSDLGYYSVGEGSIIHFGAEQSEE